MRVGLIRPDLSRIYLDDVENTSQRNFSSQPPGQSRYFEFPSNTTLLSTLNQWAFLSVPGSAAVFPLTLTGANNTLTAIVTSGGPTFTFVIATGAYTALQLAAAINAAFAAQGLSQSLVASVQPVTNSVHPGQIQIDTVAPGANTVPSFGTYYNQATSQPPIGISPSPPAPFVNPLNSGPTAFIHLGGTLATALGLATSAFSGMSVAFLASLGLGSPSGVYVNTGIAGQSGVVASIVAGPSPGVYTVTGLTGMTVNSTLHRLFITNSGSGNNGTYQIVQYISATSVNIATPPGQVLTVPDANNGSIHWNEDAVTFNISYTQIGTLSTFASMEGYNATTPTGEFLALATAIQNAVAPSLVETGLVLLSFAKGKLSILSASYFQPGYPPQTPYQSPFGFNEGATARLGYAQGPAVFITENDGMTPYTL